MNRTAFKAVAWDTFRSCPNFVEYELGLSDEAEALLDMDGGGNAWEAGRLRPAERQDPGLGRPAIPRATGSRKRIRCRRHPGCRRAQPAAAMLSQPNRRAARCLPPAPERSRRGRPGGGVLPAGPGLLSHMIRQWSDRKIRLEPWTGSTPRPPPPPPGPPRMPSTLVEAG